MTIKRNTTHRSKDEWLKIINTWKASQKNITIWCQENNIPDSSFRSAYTRLFPSESNPQELPILLRSCFQELIETIQPVNGIELCFKGITLRVSQKVDESVLLHILKIMEKL